MVVLPWTWQSCSRCEGQQESHTLIKDHGAKNKTPPVGITPRDSRRCEKALYCTRFNYHAYTLELLLCINVSWTGFLLKIPISGEECAAMHLVSELEPRLTAGITHHGWKDCPDRRHGSIACEPKLQRCRA